MPPISTPHAGCRAATSVAALLWAVGCGGSEPASGTAPVASVSVAPGSLGLTVGQTGQLTATLRDAGGTVLTGRTVTWSTSNGAAATVSSSGLVSAQGAGAATITATSEGVAGTSTVTVTTPPVGTNRALAFTAATFTGQDLGRVKIRLDQPARPVDVGATDFTLEFWLRAQAGANPQGSGCGGTSALEWIGGNIVLDRDRAGQGRKWGLSLLGGRVTFGYSTNPDTQGLSLCGGPRVDDGQWHHIAVTRRLSGALALFIDGALVASATGPGGDISYPDGAVGATNDPYLVLGAEKHDVGPAYPGFTGELDELRLSTTVRYTGAFARPTQRFSPDAATAALYHFDEGSGTTLGDASGASGGPSHGTLNVGGSPAGPTWGPSSAPTGN